MAFLRKVASLPDFSSLKAWPALRDLSGRYHPSCNVIQLSIDQRNIKLWPPEQHTRSEFIHLICKQYGYDPTQLDFRNTHLPNGHLLRQGYLLNKIFSSLELQDIFKFAASSLSHLWLVSSTCILEDILIRIIQYKLGELSEFKYYFPGNNILQKAHHFKKATGFSLFELMLRDNPLPKLFNDDYFKAKAIFKKANIRKYKIFDSEFLNLKDLYLLPKEIEFLENLTTIRIKNSKILALPDSFWNLKNIKSLELNQTAIFHLSSKIQNFTQLNSLRIINSPIILIPHEISKLSNLEKLTFNGTNIKTIPIEILKGNHIKLIYIKTSKIALNTLKLLEALLTRHKKPNTRLIFSDLLSPLKTKTKKRLKKL